MAGARQAHEQAHLIGHRAVSWLADNAEWLAPDLFHGSLPGLTVKAICDVSVLVRCRALLFGLNGRYAQLGSGVFEIVESAQYPATLRAHPRDLHLYGLPYAAAKAAGLRDFAVDTAIAEVLASRTPLHVERRPYEQLAVAHLIESLGLDQDVLRPASIVATTLLAGQPDPQLVRPVDAYAIAHSVFYLTDYGRRPAAYLPYPSEHAVQLVRRLLYRFCSADYPDLVAELAIAVVCLQQHVDEMVTETLAFIKCHQRYDGTIALKRDCLELSAGASSYARRQWWERHYHTAVVTTLLASLVEKHHLA